MSITRRNVWQSSMPNACATTSSNSLMRLLRSIRLNLDAAFLSPAFAPRLQVWFQPSFSTASK